jgi:hypothetical protein
MNSRGKSLENSFRFNSQPFQSFDGNGHVITCSRRSSVAAAMFVVHG